MNNTDLEGSTEFSMPPPISLIVNPLHYLALSATVAAFALAEASAEVTFSTGFQYSNGAPTVGQDAANLNGADGQVGSWSGILPSGTSGDGGSELATIGTTTGSNGGAQLLRLDRGTAGFTIVAEFAEPIQLDGASFTFDYATRRTIGSHDRDNHIIGYDAAGEEAFHLIASAKSFGAGEATRLGYMASGLAQFDLPTVSGDDSNNDLSFFNGDTDRWPNGIGTIEVQLTSTGYAIVFDNGDNTYTTTELPYNGSATQLTRVEFSGSNNSGLWLDNIVAEGTRDSIISSFTATPLVVAPGETATLNWEVDDFDSVSLDGADASALTDLNGVGSATRTISQTQQFELTATRSTETDTATLRVIASPSPVLITEVMSDNDNTLQAADGSSPDWIELTNFGSTEIDLGGWHLTDDPEELDKSTFPTPTLLATGESLIVFASGGRFHPRRTPRRLLPQQQRRIPRPRAARWRHRRTRVLPFSASHERGRIIWPSTRPRCHGILRQPDPGRDERPADPDYRPAHF